MVKKIYVTAAMLYYTKNQERQKQPSGRHTPFVCSLLILFHSLSWSSLGRAAEELEPVAIFTACPCENLCNCIIRE